ncbi:MAG: putative bacteriocin export ABC transporter [Ruminococcus sp.]|nr:putative bacteriocin export ABC transporter [Ruminococcus sp.]
MICVKLENINKSYGNNKILNDFSLSVEQGEFIAICGKSGAGKSTLLNIIGLLENPDSGNIIINNIKNPEFNANSGRKLLQTHIGYLFQNYGLIENESVNYNLKIASKFRKWDRKTETEKFSESLEKVGLNTNIESKKIFQLSGGEQQRIAIARLLIKSPDIILADEPTGSLDVENKRIVMELLKYLNGTGTTIILVTHDEEVRECAERIITL